MKQFHSQMWLPVPKPAVKHAFAVAASLLMGLALSLAASAFVQNNGQSAGSSMPPKNRVFRVGIWIEKPGETPLPHRKTAGQLAPALEGRLPALEASARFMAWPEPVLLSNFSRSLTVNRWCFADQELSGMFGLAYLRGDAGSALVLPAQVVLTASVSKKIFGTIECVGKTIMGLGGKIYTVSGVVRDPEPDSALQFDLLASWSSTLEKSGVHDFRFMNNWTGNAVETFILLNRPEEAPGAARRIPEMVRQEVRGSQAGYYSFFLEPIAEPLSSKVPKIRTNCSKTGQKFSESLYTPHPGMITLDARACWL